jgi:PAS domain S-box-containing protein
MPKILVVDESKDKLEMFAVVLKDAGHEVITETDLHEVVKTAEKENPDLILMNIEGEDTAGVDSIKTLKANDSTREIMVVIHSDSAEAGKIFKESLEAGAEDFLRLPADQREIIGRVTIGIHRRLAIAELRTQDKVLQLSRSAMESQYKFLRTIIDTFSHPLTVIDVKDYSIKMANAAASAGNLLEGVTCYGLTHNKENPCVGDHPCPLCAVQKTKKPVIMDHIHSDKDGNKRNVEVHGFPVFDESGEVVQVLEYCIDVTEKREKARLLDMFKTFAETSNQGMGWADGNGTVVYANPALAKLFGEKDSESLLGKNSTKTYYPEEEQKRMKEEIFPDVLNNGEWSGELNILQTNGEILTSYNSMFIICDQWSEDVFFANIVTDISMQKKNEDLLSKQVDEAKIFMEMTREREDRIILFKREVNALCGELGRPEVYDLSFLN